MERLRILKKWEQFTISLLVKIGGSLLISDCLLIARIETTRPNRHCDDRALTCHDERVLYESTSSVGVLDYGLPERANQQKDTSI